VTDSGEMSSRLMPSEEREINRPFDPTSRLLDCQNASLILNEYEHTVSWTGPRPGTIELKFAHCNTAVGTDVRGIEKVFYTTESAKFLLLSN
jgi:hypothetical protein